MDASHALPLLLMITGPLSVVSLQVARCKCNAANSTSTRYMSIWRDRYPLYASELTHPYDRRNFCIVPREPMHHRRLDASPLFLQMHGRSAPSSPAHPSQWRTNPCPSTFPKSPMFRLSIMPVTKAQTRTRYGPSPKLP